MKGGVYRMLTFFLPQSLGKRKCKNRADGYRQPYFLSVIHLLSIPISFIFFVCPNKTRQDWKLSLDFKKYRYAFEFPIKKGPANNAGP